MQDYVLAGDTDSIFIMTETFILNNIKDKDKWLNLDDENKIDVIQKLSESIGKHVNDKMFKETQSKTYNSTIEDFKITYAIEKIAKSGLFLKKKKYALLNVVKDDIRITPEIAITGLEVVRSETPVFFREALKLVLEMILKDVEDAEIQKSIHEYKKKALELPVEDISANIGINQLSKYIDSNGNSLKGAPWQIKGVANYNKCLNILCLWGKYPEIMEGNKAKVVYVKDNQQKIDSISYHRWPKEFAKLGIVPDKEKMISKFFLTKVEYLLSPMGKEHILENKVNLNLFFG